MANGEDTIRLLVDMGASSRNIEAVSTDLDELVAAAVRATEAQKAMARMMADVPQATTQVSTALADLKGEKSAGGRGFLGLSYGIQDVITVLSYGGGWQRALMSATNNISPALAAIGGAGLAGAIGLVATAATAAVPVLEQLFGTFESATLDKASMKLDNMARRAKELQAAFEGLAGPQVKAGFPAESAQMIAEFFRMEPGGGRAVQQRIARALREAGMVGPTAQEERDIAAARQREEAARGALIPGVAEAARGYRVGLEAEVFRRVFGESEQQAGTMMAKALDDPKVAGQIEALATALPDLFSRGFARNLADLTPEALRRSQEELDDEAAEDDRRRDRRRAAQALSARQARARDEIRRGEGLFAAVPGAGAMALTPAQGRLLARQGQAQREQERAREELRRGEGAFAAVPGAGAMALTASQRGMLRRQGQEQAEAQREAERDERLRLLANQRQTAAILRARAEFRRLDADVRRELREADRLSGPPGRNFGHR